MPSESKIIRLLSQLTKLTVKDELIWTVKEPPDSLTHGTNDVIPLYCETEYKEQIIGLAQRRYQEYDGERDQFYWTEGVVLLFVDYRGRVVWEERSPSAALYTLFNAVREKIADVDGILKNLLDDEEEDI